MKILVINLPFIAHYCRCQRWPARTRARALRPPDWLCYAAAVLKKSGLDVELYDFAANNWDKSRLKGLVRQKKPAFVILDSTTPSIYSDIECAGICKQESGAKVIMTGTHATALPQETFKLSSGNIDAIALGEYDYTVRDIIRNWPDLDNAAGVCYLKDGQLKFTSPRPLIEDLDSLPFPAWEYIDIMKYFDAGRLYPYIDIIGGRGCPYQCTFCQWPQLMFGHKYRFRSAGNIADEIEYDLGLFPGLKYGEFFFEDDTFTVNKDRAYSICAEIGSRGLKINWSINARPDIYDLKLFREMKVRGCREFLVGFESGDQGILDNAKKGLNVAQAEEFVRLAKEAKIGIHGCFVLGLPGETKETARKTIDFALSLKLDTLQFSAAVPLPGSEYFNYCQSQKLLMAKSWNDWLNAGEQGAVVDYPGLTIKDINALVDEGLKKFYFSPRFIFKFAFHNKNIFDIYRKLKGAYNFLSYLICK
ncbi:MAG: radical SAM protein [Candidatus Omnitrophica bacterium]|nr:radical SAM protein [Candidatus Omnitrophota bacterium]